MWIFRAGRQRVATIHVGNGGFFSFRYPDGNADERFSRGVCHNTRDSLHAFVGARCVLRDGVLHGYAYEEAYRE